jgi:hypothetical protein
MQREQAAKAAEAERKPESSSLRRAQPRATSPHPILQLQQLAGNRAVGRFLQAKLRVGQPGDAYEQEADRVANQVMRMPDPRAGDGPDLAKTDAQRKCAACEEEEKLQRKETGNAANTPATAPPIVHKALSAPGQPLDSATRNFFEPRFGTDFGAVRVHTGSKAAESARAVNARAFTRGRDIFFGASEFKPDSTTGRMLIAHELVHTIQQKAILPFTDQHIVSKPLEEVPDVQRDAGPAKAPARASLTVRWTGDFRSSIFNYVKTLTGQEEAARLTSALIDAADVFYVQGNKVKRNEFEAWASKNKTFILYPSMTQALLDYFHTDLEGLKKRSQLGELAEEVLQSISGPDIPDASAVGKELKQEQKSEKPIRAVSADWSVLAKSPDLAKFYLKLMQQFGDVKLTDELTQSAQDGLSEEELKKIIGGNPKRKYLTGLFTQAYREFTAAGGKDVAAFKPLAERIIEQTAWGNPTATHNLLKIGEGWPERGRLGIVNRMDDVLLYDETGAPLPSFGGAGMRDPGYIGAKQFTWGIDISGITDPALKGILNSLRQQVGDPTRAVIIGAQQYFDNMEYVDGIVKKGLAAEVVARFKDMLPIVLGFMAGHGLSTVLMRMPPPWIAIGAALKGLLIAAGYVLELDFAGSALSRLLEAGYHLSRIQRDPDQQLTELSKYHIEEAAVPLRSLIADIAAMVLVGKLMEILQGGGKRASLKCQSPCDAEFEGKGKGKEEPTVKKPTPEVRKAIGEYVEALNKLRDAMERKDADAEKSAKKTLDRIEEDALKNAGKGGAFDQLLDHINTLTDVRSSIEKGNLRFPYEEPPGSRKFVEGIGRRFDYDCVKRGLKGGMTYSEVEGKLGWPPKSSDVRPEGAARLTWQLADGSLVHLDVPGPENVSPYEISRHPHLALTAPPPYQALHLSEGGIGVPFDSTPAHIEVRGDPQLTRRLDPLRAGTKK